MYYDRPGSKWKGKVHHRTVHEDPEGQQRYSSTLSLTLVLNGAGWLIPRPGRFTPGKELGTHFAGGWMGPRAILDG
jgi:hypothetical protein